MPIGAGFVVAYLQSWGFSPALKFLTRAIEGVVDDSKNAAYPTSYWQVSACANGGCLSWFAAASAAPAAVAWARAMALRYCMQAAVQRPQPQGCYCHMHLPVTSDELFSAWYVVGAGVPPCCCVCCDAG
jgi:hypothetical protein